jgi:serine/threonine protein phosphatase PrpC
MPATPDRRPHQSDIDIHGVTHRGLVRAENQDHFLIASMQKAMRVVTSSLAPDTFDALATGSRGYLFCVADGVGSGDGRRASSTALHAIVQHVTAFANLYAQFDHAEEERFVSELRAGVLHGHEVLRRELEGGGHRNGMATTLTMVAVLWPHAFLVHVGDSRCYRLRDGKLELLSRDQTLAEALREDGTLTEPEADRSPLKHVLVSALGSAEATPQTSVQECRWEDVMLLCTDGLTKHVTDDEIAAVLQNIFSAEQACQDLVDLVLARGGSDNVTLVIGRLRS